MADYSARMAAIERADTLRRLTREAEELHLTLEEYMRRVYNVTHVDERYNETRLRGIGVASGTENRVGPRWMASADSLRATTYDTGDARTLRAHNRVTVTRPDGTVRTVPASSYRRERVTRRAAGTTETVQTRVARDIARQQAMPSIHDEATV